MNPRVQVYYEIVNLIARSSCVFGANLLCLLAVPRRDCKMVLINCGPFRSNHIRNNGGSWNSGIFTIEKALQVGCKPCREYIYRRDFSMGHTHLLRRFPVGSGRVCSKDGGQTTKNNVFRYFFHQNVDKITSKTLSMLTNTHSFIL